MAVTRIKNNQITDSTVNAAAKLQNYSITSNKIANNLTYGSSLTIAGNLTVQGNVTAVDTTDLVVEDPLILLAKDQTGVPSLDIGFIGKRGTETNIAFVWDESADEFATIFTSSEVTNTVVTIDAYASLHIKDLTASNITSLGNFSANVQSANSLTVTDLTANTINTDTIDTTGNVVVGGNLVVQGNITYININDLRVEDPIIILGTGPNGNVLTSDDGKDRGVYMEYYKTAGGLGNAFYGWQNSTGNLLIASNANFSGNDVVSVVQYGTLNVGNSYHESATIEGNFLARGTGINFRVEGDGAQGNLLTTDATANTVMIKTANAIAGSSFTVNSEDSIVLPVGNNGARPGSPVVGMFRFNTTADAIEYYATTGWEGVAADFTVITYDEFQGDNSTTVFNLSESISTAGALIAINGVVQLPFTAYNIAGNVLTFTEAPESTDTIDVRLITTTAEVTSLANPVGTASITADQTLGFFTILGNLLPNPDNTYSLGNATNRWSKGWFAANSVIIGNIALSESGNVLQFTNIEGNTPVPIGANELQNGTSNVVIPTANGNVQIYRAGTKVGEFANGFNIFTGTVESTANLLAYQHVYAGNAVPWLVAESIDDVGHEVLAVANVDGKVDGVIVNQNSGNLSYAEWLAANDSGNIDQGWISMGINSSNYLDPAFLLTGADDGYLLYEAPANSTGSGNLVIATGGNGTENAIVFGAGGFATGNTQMTIIPDQNVHIEIPTDSVNAATGALTVVGGVGIQGNVSIGGNLSVSLTSTITANNFNAQEHVWSGPVEQWLISKQETDTGRRIAAVANIAGPAETLQTNESADQLAYSEFISVNNLGNISAGWISTGINSSTYNDPAFLLTGADDGYLLFETNTGSAGAGNLVIATGSNGLINAIVFGAGGFATGNTQMVIFPDDKVTINIPTESTSTGTGALVVSGGVGLLGNLNVGGDVNVVGNITLGGSGNTIDVSALAVSEPIIYMGANNAADVLDLGFAGEYKQANIATYAGLVRDASDGSFRFFANVSPRPNNTVNFSDPNLFYPTVYAGNLNITGVTAAVNTTTGSIVAAGGVGVAGALYVGGITNFTGNTTASNVSVTSLTAQSATVTGKTTVNSSGGTIAIENAAANGVGNIGTSSGYFNTAFLKATSAQYADLAEMYTADANYEPGTVVSFGGEREVTMSSTTSDARVAGVISTNPSYLMNSGQQGEHVVAVALTGRVPTRVTGAVRKGDMMVSAGDGTACACSAPQIGTVIGKALQDHSGGSGTIEVVVGRL